jgi:Cys-rich repeat protein
VECLADADCGGGFSCDAARRTCWQSGCANSASTEATDTVSGSGCALRLRDTSACRAEREAQGLSGAWLKFTCRTTLTQVTVNGQPFVQLSSDNEPDYESLYFGSGDACYESDNTRIFPDPNDIVAQSIVMTAPLTPTTSNGNTPVPGSGIGLAIDGVVLFSDVAAPGDDIYQEAGSFDRCQGHPQNTGVYHHHSEPFTITQDDDALVGVMRDGYFVYGRRDPDGSSPGANGGGLTTPYYGHVGVTVDSPTTPVFHYHVHYETNGTESAYFITPQRFYGTVVGSCANGAGGC